MLISFAWTANSPSTGRETAVPWAAPSAKGFSQLPAQNRTLFRPVRQLRRRLYTAIGFCLRCTPLCDIVNGPNERMQHTVHREKLDTNIRKKTSKVKDFFIFLKKQVCFSSFCRHLLKKSQNTKQRRQCLTIFQKSQSRLHNAHTDRFCDDISAEKIKRKSLRAVNPQAFSIRINNPLYFKNLPQNTAEQFRTFVQYNLHTGPLRFQDLIRKQPHKISAAAAIISSN